MNTVCVGIVFFMWCHPAAAPSGIAAPFCDTAKPIYWSPGDTRKTKEQADQHNAVGKRLCGWKGS